MYIVYCGNRTASVSIYLSTSSSIFLKMSLILFFKVIITSPSVPYKLITKGKDVIKRLGPEIIVSNPSHWLDGSQVWTLATTG